MNKKIKSPLNYIGGKYKLLDQILPLFPKEINNYVDLFCGGCNVGLNVRANTYLFNDNLIFLIDMYNEFVNKDYVYILNHIDSQIERFDLSKTNTEGYMLLRNEYNMNKNPLDLFVLICYSFNHQIRFNNKHLYNNPFGRNRSSFNERIKLNLELFLNKLNTINANFTSVNFNLLNLEFLQNGDFVYCDPPYLITTGSYNDGKRGFTGWTEVEERNLYNLLDELNDRNVSFALSNVLEHKELKNNILINWIEQNNYNINFLDKNYNNSNYQSNKGISKEVLVTNYI